MREFRILICTLLGLLLVCGACTKSGGDDEGTDGAPNPNPGTGNQVFVTECGTPIDGRLQNPVNSSDGEEVTISRLGTDGTIIINRQGGEQLIKLRALSENLLSFVSQRARNIISNFPTQVVLFTEDCEITTRLGARAFVGDVFSTSGVSLTELLIQEGATAIDGTGSCGEALVAGCYQELLESSAPVIGGVISNFLWKPEADRDGNLVVLLNPSGATIVVNGETLVGSGPSNGRGTTARGNRPGAAYGVNIELEAFDASGRPLAFPDGSTTLIIANGAQRVEIP